MSANDRAAASTTTLPEQPNGTHRAAKRNGANGRPSNGKSGHEPAVQPPTLVAMAGPQALQARSGARKRSSNGMPGDESAEQPAAAPFVIAEPQPIEATMWPIHPVMWLQPELAPLLPSWSGLSIEHRDRPPAPDFLYADARPAGRVDALSGACAPRPPDVRRELPQSDLAPLGWDPRAVADRERGKGEGE
jgi:hypothetical protein